jgi:nitroreductase
MDLREAIEKRTSVRQFNADPVKREDLQEMIRLAAMAPSMNNFQPWKFYVITRRNLLDEMAELISDRIAGLPRNDSMAAENILSQVEFFSTFFRFAPAVIAVTLEPYETVLERGIKLSHDEINKLRAYPDLQSAGACVQNLLLSAVAMGYGACWLSSPVMASDALEKILNIPSTDRLVCFVAVGHPMKNPVPKQKKDLHEVLVWID